MNDFQNSDFVKFVNPVRTTRLSSNLRHNERTNRSACFRSTGSHSEEWLKVLWDSYYGLFVLLHEVSVWIHFKLRIFTVHFGEHLVVPLAIGIVFPHYLHNVSACR